MKKLLFAALAACAILATSCNSDDEASAGADNGIIGTWTAMEDAHYPSVTFNKDGTYEWQWLGYARFKDSGTYTYEDGVVTMKFSKVYELYDGTWTEADWVEARTRTCVITELVSGGCVNVLVKDDYMMAIEIEFLMFRDGYSQEIKKADLVGTWEIEGEYTGERMILGSDGDYTDYDWYVNQEDGGILAVTKYTGTWSVSKNVLTITNTKMLVSCKGLGWNAETQKNEYVYYTVNPETLEADQWETYEVNWAPEALTIAIADGLLYSPRGTFTKK